MNYEEIQAKDTIAQKSLDQQFQLQPERLILPANTSAKSMSMACNMTKWKKISTEKKWLGYAESAAHS